MRVVALLLALPAAALGFKITFPTPSDYWVACGFNNLRWEAGSDDPAIFSVVFENTNKTLLNDDYSVGNSLNSKQGQAQIHVPCLVAAQHYQLLLVNSSMYEHNGTGVYLSSDEFELKPNGTKPAPSSGQTEISNTEDPAYAQASTNSSMSIPQNQGTSSTTTSSTEQKDPSSASAANNGQTAVPTTDNKANAAAAMHAPAGLAVLALAAGVYTLL